MGDNDTKDTYEADDSILNPSGKGESGNLLPGSPLKFPLELIEVRNISIARGATHSFSRSSFR